MYVLVFWICNAFCTTTVLPGYYSNLAACESAKETIITGVPVLSPIPTVVCLPAPENIGFE